MKEITFKQLPFKAVSMFFGGLRPAVFKKDNGTFGIRIKTGESRIGQNISENWEYFDLDSTGLITASPRGYASQFNKKVRIIDIEQAVDEYSNKVIN